MSRRPLSYLPALDGLRGLAVLAVLAFHAGHLRGGYLGVDLFFVLSGFLITRLLLDESARNDRIGLGRFWERRARRLLPALGVMLVGVAAYAKFVAQPQSLHQLRMDGLATVFYVANWRAIFGHADYWALFTSPSPLEHTWSLAIEEQFYVVWPLVFAALAWLVGRRSRRRQSGDPAYGVAVFAVAVTGAMASAAWALHLADGGVNRVYYGTDTRAFAILVGAALAAAVHRWGHPTHSVPRWIIEAGGAAGAVVLAAAWVRLDGASPHLLHGGLLVCSLAAGAVVLAITTPAPSVLGRIIGFAPLRWVGLISYGVYLYHWPLYVWLDERRVGHGGWFLVAVRLAATFAVAVVSYRFLEQPIRHGRSSRVFPKIAVPSIGAACVAGLLVAATAGYQPGPTSIYTTASLRQAISLSQQRGGPRLLIVGNSVGWDMAHEGFSKMASNPQATSFNLARIGCEYPDNEGVDPPGPTPVSEVVSCREHWFEVADQLKPDYVVFIRDGVDGSVFVHDGQRLEACSAGYAKWLKSSLLADAKRFAKSGAKTVLVTSAYSEHLFFIKQDWPTYLRSVDCANEAMREVARANPRIMKLVDLERHLCKPDGTCEQTLNGVTLRPDGMHFKDEGALYISRWIASQLGIETTG